jgi:hypothetical protein
VEGVIKAPRRSRVVGSARVDIGEDGMMVGRRDEAW